MIQFKISVNIASLSCSKSPYNKVGDFADNPIFNRYDVYINNQLLSVINNNEFQVNVALNSIVELKVIDKTGRVSDYYNSFQLYDRNVWFDITLLHDKYNVSIPNYECHLGIDGDYLQGSNYFRWDFVGFDSLNAPVNQTIRVRRPRVSGDYTPPIQGQLIPFSTLWATEATVVNTDSNSVSVVNTVGWYAEFSFRVNGYESYYTQSGSLWRLTSSATNLIPLYLIYLHQTGYTNQEACCSELPTANIVSECVYNFQIPYSIERDYQYCSAEFDLIDIPCSKNKMLYRTSSTKGSLIVYYKCDGVWKQVGEMGSSLLLPIETLCSTEEVDIKVTCNILGDSGTCCGNIPLSSSSVCEQERTIRTLNHCVTGDIIGQQDHCVSIVGCDDCGDIPDKYITENPIEFRVNKEWNNLVIYYYHKEEFVELKDTFKSTDTIVPNKTQWTIEKLNPVSKMYEGIYQGNVINSPNDDKLLHTFEESGIYKVIASLTNTCGTQTIEQLIYVYANNVIIREQCSLYKLLHCIDRDNTLTIRSYKDNSIIYNWNPLTEVETKTSFVNVVYDSDLYLYRLTFTTDDIYKIEYNNKEFIVFHDCFITNCHQEYIKSLLCETDLCKVLLDDCKVTDDTLLKVYMIQKYVLLYDIYKSLVSKIVNIEYANVIEPNVLLEENYCVDLYNIWDIIAKLKEMCVNCGFDVTNKTDDCGCN